MLSQISNGNLSVVSGLNSVVAAINSQTAAQQAEIKRQQDLSIAQKALESLAGSGADKDIARQQQELQSLIDQRNSKQAFIDAITPNWNNWSYGQRFKAGTYMAELPGLDKMISELRTSLEIKTSEYNAALESQRAIIRALGGVPAFAAGGVHAGGLRIVGENGPELEVTGPSRIYNAIQTQNILRSANVPTAVQIGSSQPGDPALRQLVSELTQEVVNLRAEARATAIASQQLQQQFNRMTRGGQSMPITGLQNDPLQVEVAA